MAFPSATRKEVQRLEVGDTVFLVTTRGCFHNPTRDRTRIIGQGRVTSPVEALDPPLALVGREFPRGCNLAISSLTPYLTGIELSTLVPRLAAFPRKDAWAILLRRPLLALTPADSRLICDRLSEVSDRLDRNLGEYLERIRPVPVKPQHRVAPESTASSGS